MKIFFPRLMNYEQILEQKQEKKKAKLHHKKKPFQIGQKKFFNII